MQIIKFYVRLPVNRIKLTITLRMVERAGLFSKYVQHNNHLRHWTWWVV